MSRPASSALSLKSVTRLCADASPSGGRPCKQTEERALRVALVLIALVVLSACTPEAMLAHHRRQNPDGPYQRSLCESPAETGTRWDCEPEKVTQLRREARALVRRVREHLALLRYLEAVEEARSSLVYRWSGVAECESGGNWSINTGNGYYGGLQFLLSTWHSVGGSGYPHQNSPAEQAYRAEILKDRAGLGQWPHCGRYYR